MATETEGTFTIGGKELYTKTGRARFDQRGWGRSVRVPADKGLTGPTAQGHRRYGRLYRSVLAAEPSTGARLRHGNSMGGGQVATLASDPAYEDLVGSIRGFVPRGPLHRVPRRRGPPAPSRSSSASSPAAGLPRQQLVNAHCDAEYFSRDPEGRQERPRGPACATTRAPSRASRACSSGRSAGLGPRPAGEQVRSLFLAHGTGDKTTSWEASRKWFDAQGSRDGRYKEYEGCYHQLHADLCKDEFYTDVGDWILERTEDRPGPKL
ncbi:alpha/beta hydrolase [Verticillium dahliae]|nr:alpha/beta hydrolase [Verticillium dahliae]